MRLGQVNYVFEAKHKLLMNWLKKWCLAFSQRDIVPNAKTLFSTGKIRIFNGKLIKWQIDQMASNDKLTKWQVDQLAS